jgi:hypothetical protein
VLGALVEKSLVVADDDGDRVRYRLLESSRAYALEKLTESGTRATLADRHAHWVSAFVERAYERGWTEPVRRWLADVEPEADNVRSALDWALGAGEFVLAGHTISLLSTYWFECASAEGQRWVDAALAHLDAAAHCVQVGRLLLVSAVLGHSDRSIEAAERAISPLEAAGDSRTLAQAYLRLALGRSPNSRSARANIFRSLRLDGTPVLHPLVPRQFVEPSRPVRQPDRCGRKPARRFQA